MVNVGFIGAGNMAYALGKAMCDKKLVSSLHFFDLVKERLDLVEKDFNAKTYSSNKEVVENSDLIFVAVKPQVINIILEDIKEFLTEDKIIVSIAAGVKISKFQEKLSNGIKLVRVMPNTPCLVGEMAAAYSVSDGVSENEIKLINSLLNSAGKAYLVDENLLDAVTGLSGSGPAFVARLIQAFIEEGIENGLEKEIAKNLTLQTFIGTAKLLENISPDDLVEMVSSPNGTTVAGREVLESSNYKKILKNTIKRAVERSKKLGYE